MKFEIFKKLFLNNNYCDNNGDVMIIAETGSYTYNSDKKDGYIPCQFVWDFCNNGQEMIAFTGTYYVKVHTFGIKYSCNLYIFQMNWHCSKRYKSSKMWNKMKSARKPSRQ